MRIVIGSFSLILFNISFDLSSSPLLCGPNLSLWIISILFTGSLLIEVIFSLDGLGLLGYESVLNRDYPVVFGTLYIFTFFGLLLHLITDLTYVIIDPRIDFENRST